MSSKLEESNFHRNVEIHAEGPVDYGRTIAIHIIEKGAEHFRVATSITMETVEQGVMLPPPVLRLPMRTAQLLMDNLWQCGLRPTEGAGSAGSLAATQRHLEDMRTIVFKNVLAVHTRGED